MLRQKAIKINKAVLPGDHGNEVKPLGMSKRTGAANHAAAVAAAIFQHLATSDLWMCDGCTAGSSASASASAIGF